jgi:hypothetical protein
MACSAGRSASGGNRAARPAPFRGSFRRGPARCPPWLRLHRRPRISVTPSHPTCTRPDRRPTVPGPAAWPRARPHWQAQGRSCASQKKLKIFEIFVSFPSPGRYDGCGASHSARPRPSERPRRKDNGPPCRSCGTSGRSPPWGSSSSASSCIRSGGRPRASSAPRTFPGGRAGLGCPSGGARGREHHAGYAARRAVGRRGGAGRVVLPAEAGRTAEP